MGNGLENNWVERRYAREQHLSDLGRLWNDVCTALSSAIRSFNKLYRQDKVPVEINRGADNGHFQVVIPNEAGSPTIHIDINVNGRKIHAQYSNGLSNRSFQLDANHESAYIKYIDDRCDVDEVSRMILERVLFPVQGEYGWRPERIL